MQKWNISTDRAQRVDEKNVVICLVMFTPAVMVINDSLFVFSVDDSKKRVAVCVKCLRASERSH